MYIAIKTFDKPCLLDVYIICTLSSDQFNLHTFEPHEKGMSIPNNNSLTVLVDYKSIALQGHTNYVLIN